MSCCEANVIEVAKGAEANARRALVEELAGQARLLKDGRVNYQVSAPAIHCAKCINTLERELARLPDVAEARANLSLKQVSVSLKSSDGQLGPVLSRMEDLGFKPQAVGHGPGARDDVQRGLLRALAVAGFAAANIMLLSVSVWFGADGVTEQFFHYLSALIAIPAVAYAGRPFFSSALTALKSRHVNMDVPISLGVLLATGMSMYESFVGGGQAYFDAAVSLLFFLLIGRVMDHMMRSKARAAAGRLAQLAAKGGMVVGENGGLTYLPLSGIRPGMILRVVAGERFPVDGEIIDGVSDVDRALVTGESAPVALRQGASVEAGTLNLTGSVDIRATRPADQSFLAEIIHMMEAAEHGRSAYLQLSDRMARAYAPAVHTLAAATFFGWLIYTHGSFHSSLTAAISVLIITCPCALGLAVPVAHVVGAGRLFANGILMKDGSALERLASADTVAFDKTGTLTTGTPTVKSLGIPSGEAASLALALAQRSNHPASKALVDALNGADVISVSALTEHPGQGVEAIYRSRRVRLGRGQWVAEIAAKDAAPAHGAGLAFAIENGPISFSTLSEQLRPGAREIAKTFAAQNIPSLILSGDGEGPVQSVAQACGITEAHSGLRPGKKLDLLKKLRDAGRHVLMVGDGLNDAPALAAASVSMAPASASDVGRMAADFVFTRDDLSAVAFAHQVALKTARIVKQNFGLAIAYNIFAVPLAMAGQLNPLIAAVAMSTSSIIVVANSLRLQLLAPDRAGVETSEQPRAHQGAEMAFG